MLLQGFYVPGVPTGIPPGGVTSGSIASGAVGNNQIASGAVQLGHMASGSVVGYFGNPTAGAIVWGSIGPNDLGTGAVGFGTQIVPGIINRNHLVSGLLQANLQFTITGIASGEKGDLLVPYDCQLNYLNVSSDQSGGSCFVGVWRDSQANYPPTSGDTIAPSGVPLISGAIMKSYSGTAALSGWVTAFNKGDILKFAVHSGLTMTRVTVAMQVGVTTSN